jgi:hypothetical protein
MKKSALRLLQGGFVGLLLVGAPGYSQQEIQWNVIEEDSSPATVTESSPQWEVVNPEFNGDRRENNASSPTNVVWEPIHPDHPESSVNTAEDKSNQPKTSIIVWEEIEADDMIVIEESVTEPVTPQSVEEAIAIVRRVTEPTAATFANGRALWRNERWLPQISYLVPNGYGPYGVMFDVSVTGTDCTLGKGPCEPFTTFNEWQNSLDTQANGEVYFNAGIGNASSWGGILITNSLERIPAAAKSGSSIGNPLQGVQTGLHYAKAFGPDTSFRTGVENLITWDSEDYTYADMTRNFYLVGSQRIRLKSPDINSKWFRNAYLTAGIGNGEFKPIEQTFKDQTEALKNAGCATYGYTPKNPCSNERFKRALRTGSDYGQINPIAAISVEVIDGFHLISEWTGRNLNAGFSWRPFESFGLVITPMINSIVQNCEYPGCRVTPIHGYPERVPLPDAVLTERVRLSLQASLQIKF